MNISKCICDIFTRGLEERIIKKEEYEDLKKQDPNIIKIQDLNDNKFKIKVHIINNRTGFFVKYKDTFFLCTVLHNFSFLDFNSTFVILSDQFDNAIKIFINEFTNESSFFKEPKHDLAVFKVEKKCLRNYKTDFLELITDKIKTKESTVTYGFPYDPKLNFIFNPEKFNSEIICCNLCQKEKTDTEYYYLSKPSILGYSGGPVVLNNKVCGIIHGSTFDEHNNLLNGLAIPTYYLIQLLDKAKS